jgi:hypothetical protein
MMMIHRRRSYSPTTGILRKVDIIPHNRSKYQSILVFLSELSMVKV